MMKKQYDRRDEEGDHYIGNKKTSGNIMIMIGFVSRVTIILVVAFSFLTTVTYVFFECSVSTVNTTVNRGKKITRK